MPAITPVTVTGTFLSSSGNPMAGTLTFTLTAAMLNGADAIPPAPITVTLDNTGSFSVSLLANDDPATVPQGVQYGVTEQISGAQPRDYAILVSAATNPVNIAALMPGDTGWQ